MSTQIFTNFHYDDDTIKNIYEDATSKLRPSDVIISQHREVGTTVFNSALAMLDGAVEFILIPAALMHRVLNSSWSLLITPFYDDVSADALSEGIHALTIPGCYGTLMSATVLTDYPKREDGDAYMKANQIVFISPPVDSECTRKFSAIDFPFDDSTS